MSSKYAKLRGSIPAFEQESTFQQKVDAWRTEMYGENPEHANVANLAAHFRDLKVQKDALEEEIGEINVALEALSQMLVTLLEGSDVENVRLSTGETVYLSYEPYPSVKDKEALLAWCKKQKMTASLTLPYQTLRGIVGELLGAGKKAPSGVEVFLKSAARVRRNGAE